MVKPAVITTAPSLHHILMYAAVAGVNPITLKSGILDTGWIIVSRGRYRWIMVSRVRYRVDYDTDRLWHLW